MTDRDPYGNRFELPEDPIEEDVPTGPSGPVGGMLEDEAQAELDYESRDMTAIVAALAAEDNAPFVQSHRHLAYVHARKISDAVNDPNQIQAVFEHRYTDNWLALVTIGERLTRRLEDGKGIPPNLSKYINDEFARQHRDTYAVESKRTFSGTDNQKHYHRKKQKAKLPEHLKKKDLTDIERKERDSLIEPLPTIGKGRHSRRMDGESDYLDEPLNDASYDDPLDDLDLSPLQLDVLNLIREGERSMLAIARELGEKRHKIEAAYRDIIERGRKSA